MINYAGMKAEEQKATVRQLPAGVYVAKVLDVAISGDAPDQTLVVMLDVCEGEYTGFYMERYYADRDAGSKYGEPKFKGTYRLRIPNERNKNAKYPESDIRRMNDMIFRFEKSNERFHWDGDEKKLKGLIVGINVQEDEYNGNSFTRIGRLEIAEDVRKGLVKPMKPRKRESQAPTLAQVADPVSGMPIVEDVSLPF